MSPSLPNPVSASPKLPRSRSSRAPGRGSTAEREGAARPGAAGAPPAATAVAGGRLGGPLDGVATAGLAAPGADFNAAGPPPQDPAAVRSLSSLHFSSVEREGRIRSDREKDRRRREEVRPLWYQAGLDLAATAAAFASTTTTARGLAGRLRQPPPSSTGTGSRQLGDRRSGRCKRRRPSFSSRLAGRGACYGVLGEPQ